MATTYDELKTEIQSELDSNNPNFIAAIPGFIHRAERRFNRMLRTLEMECRASIDIRPVGTLDADLGVYDVPDDWLSHKTVEVRTLNDVTKFHILYFRKIPELSDSNATNWLLDGYDDLYLYGSLVFAEPWLKNDPRVATWASLSDSALSELGEQDRQGRFGGGPLQSRVGTQQLFRGLDQGQGRYHYLAPYDFFDLESTGRNPRHFGFRPGVFTVEARKIHILPKPGDVEYGTATWSTCT